MFSKDKHIDTLTKQLAELSLQMEDIRKQVSGLRREIELTPRPDNGLRPHVEKAIKALYEHDDKAYKSAMLNI